MAYNPNIPPQKEEDLLTYLDNEFQRVAVAFNDVADGLYRIWHSPPPKLKPGLILYADGTDWNPGSGEGLYRYNLAGSWVFIG